MTSEKPLTSEIPQQSAFERMQTFLWEKGELIKQELHYNATFALGSEWVRQEMDLHIGQRLPPEGDKQTHHGINITLMNGKLYKKNRRKEELPGKALTEITLVDPANKKREKVIIRPLDPVGHWLGLEKEAWREDKDDFGRYATTESEEEAAKIVKAFTTIYTPPGAPNRVGERVLTRRSLLLMAAAGVGIGILPKIPDFFKQVKQESPEPPNPEIEAKRREIEERFDIKIESQGSISMKHLLFLDKSLSLLPEHFRQRDRKGRQLVIILVPDKDIGECRCGAYWSKIPNAIEVGFPRVESEEKFKSYLDRLTHELTHWITISSPASIGEQEAYFLEPYKSKIEQLMQELGIHIGRSPLMLNINLKLVPFVEPDPEQLPSSKYSLENYDGFLNSGYRVKRELLDAAEEREGVDPEWLDSEKFEKYSFYRMLSYGLGTGHRPRGTEEYWPTEFVAVLAGHYVYGREYFFENYGEFFDQEIVKRLYNFVKEEIFRDREY